MQWNRRRDHIIVCARCANYFTVPTETFRQFANSNGPAWWCTMCRQSWRQFANLINRL